MKKPNSILHILFSIYAWIVASVFLVVYFFVFMVSLLPGYNKGYYVIRSFFLVYYLLWSPIRVSYHPDFDPHEPYVLIQNHVNVLDAFLVGRHSPNPTCGLMHAWQFKVPFYGWVMKHSKGIPVDPKRKDNIKTMIMHAKDRYEQGLSIITFPEGGRTLSGAMKPFKKGVFMMAAEVGYPVVPVTVRGNYQINQKGSKRFWPHPIEIYVGKPRTMKKDSKKELQKTMDELHQEMTYFLENGHPIHENS